MTDIRKRNAEELRRKWKQFLKEQKNGRDTKGKRDIKARTKKME